MTDPYGHGTLGTGCKRPRHSQFECQNEPLCGCSFCGKDQVMKRDCPYQPGNRAAGRACIENLPAEPMFDSRIFILVTVGEYNTAALVDPGSVCSFVNRSMAQRCLRAGWHAASEDGTITLANGSETNLTACVTGTAIIDGTALTHNYYILETMDHDVLLGMDALTQMGLEVRLNHRPLFTSSTPGTTVQAPPVPPERSSGSSRATKRPRPSSTSPSLRGLPQAPSTPSVPPPALEATTVAPSQPPRLPSPTPPPFQPSPVPLPPNLADRQSRVNVLPDGTAIQCPIGSSRYRARINGVLWPLRLRPTTGEITHIGQPRSYTVTPPPSGRCPADHKRGDYTRDTDLC